MKKSIVILIVVLLFVGTVTTEYVRVKMMIPLAQHQQELEKTRAEAESHYRQALDEERHRREMNKLYTKSTPRAIDAQRRSGLAQLEIDALNSKLINISTISLMLSRDPEFNAANLKKQEEDKIRLREEVISWTKERDKAGTEFSDALADLKYAKTELEKLGVDV